jgi:signal transduction histidine kinase
VVGVIELYSRRVRRRDRELLATLQAGCDQIGHYLGRARTQNEVRRRKDELLALVSHELRTPLTSIIGYLSLLDGPQDPAMARALTTINRNARRLGRLVDDLLFAARAEAGAFPLERRPTEVGEVLRGSVESLRQRANEVGVRLEFSGSGPATCDGDPDRLAQAFENLISNAIKFTGEGDWVIAHLDTEDERIVVRVSDSGPGIVPGGTESILEPFVQVPDEHGVVSAGAGLGLAITRAIVEAHDGTITVESDPGVGTTFTISLPALVRSRPAAALRAEGAGHDEADA